MGERPWKCPQWAHMHVHTQHTYILPEMHDLPGTDTLRSYLCARLAGIHLSCPHAHTSKTPDLADLSLPSFLFQVAGWEPQCLLGHDPG